MEMRSTGDSSCSTGESKEKLDLSLTLLWKAKADLRSTAVGGAEDVVPSIMPAVGARDGGCVPSATEEDEYEAAAVVTPSASNSFAPSLRHRSSLE